LDPTASFLLMRLKRGGGLLRLDKMRRDFQRLLVGIERFVLNKFRECMLEVWNPASNARPAESGMSRPSMNRRDAARAM
jgi:hypothetical protein